VRPKWQVILIIWAGLSIVTQVWAQSPVASASSAVIKPGDDIVIGSRILAEFGVLDGFGHVSARDPNNPNHFLLSRSLAPALVSADDIMEFDLDGNAVDPRGRSVFLERFIHSEVYKARPDVMAVVHTHSAGVIPFGVSQVLVRDSSRGRSLAQALGDKPVVLMRGHGDVTVGPSVRMAVFRAYYTDVNARLQLQAIALGGDVNYLTPGEGTKADAVNFVVLERVWILWAMRVAPSLGK